MSRTDLPALEYRSAFDRLGSAAREDAFRVMERLAALRENNSTDQSDVHWRESAVEYRNAERFARELEAIFRSVPLPLALSVEMPNAGDYKSIAVAGVPLLITRDQDGRVHAMRNACRHRGAEIKPAGVGNDRNLTCPYHSWVYGLDGCLKGVYGGKTTGPLDESQLGLRRLPAEERAGLIFVGLREDLEWDLDDWLGDYGPLLEGLKLDECQHWSMTTIPGPNWKVAFDGYLEGYHFSTVHRDSVYKTTYSNCAAFDQWGPHMRSSFALRSIEVEAGKPKDEWDPSLAVGIAAVVFPCLAIAGGWRDQAVVSIVLPGPTVGTSITQQHLVLRESPSDDVEEKSADMTTEWFHDVVLDEDYAVNYGVQRGLGGAEEDHEFVFLRNEPGVQHFHRIIEALVDDVPPHPARALADHRSPKEQSAI